MKNKIVLSIIPLCILALVFIAKISQAATYYVDRNSPSASDTNPGTLNSPWLTIQNAAETLAAGDTVFVRAGIYHENVYLGNSGNATDGPIVFTAFPGETPVIEGTGVAESNNGIIISASYVKLLGFEIRNWDENGIWIENATNFEISDCLVHDIFYGIGVSDGSHDFEFNRVTVFHFTLYGFDVSPSGGADNYNGMFNDCIAHTGNDPEQNVDGFALGHGNQHNFVFNRCITYNVFDGFDISSQETTLNRCLAYHCWNGAYKLWQDKIKLVNCIGYQCASSVVELDWDGTPGKVSLINCTFYGGETYTIWVENHNDILELYNCILAGGNNIGLAFEQMGTGNYHGDYNIFHNLNTARAVVVGYTDEFSLDDVASGAWTTYSGQDAHSIVVNSATGLFVDPNNDDLHLSGTSPAINNGTNQNAPSDDYDGQPRPSGTGIDIGAYEYQSATGVSQPQMKGMPEWVRLSQNVPNPFHSSTTIRYRLDIDAHIKLSLHDLLGREVKVLVNENQLAGEYEVTLSGNFLAEGCYYYKIEGKTALNTLYSVTKKLIVKK
jgi:hypothetical protein